MTSQDEQSDCCLEELIETGSLHEVLMHVDLFEAIGELNPMVIAYLSSVDNVRNLVKFVSTYSLDFDLLDADIR